MKHAWQYWPREAWIIARQPREVGEREGTWWYDYAWEVLHSGNAILENISTQIAAMGFTSGVGGRSS